MSLNGGYQIVDLKDTNFTLSQGKKVDGIYETIEGNYRKMIVFSGIVIAGKEYADAPVAVGVSETNYIATVYGYTFTIANDDTVTVTEVAA